MTYFLKDVAKYLFDKRTGDLRETNLVFPNRRARLFFNHFLSGMSSTPIWSPDYYTIADFVQKQSRREIADPVMLVFRLFEVFKKVTGSNETFDTFYFYCQMILDDFDDIDKYLIPADKLYANLNDLKALEDYYDYLEESQINTLREFWEIFNLSKESNEKEAFISIWDALFKIYTEFNDNLDADGLAYEGKAYRQLISDLESGEANNLIEGPVAFVGFNALNHAEERLFDYYKKRGDTFFFWDYDPSYTQKDYHEAGFFLRKYLKRFPAPEDFQPLHIRKEDQQITMVSVPSVISQAKVTGRCMELTGASEIKGPLDTALILADEGLLIPAVNALPEQIDKINISLGYPINDTPACHLVDLLAKLQKNRKPQDDGRMLFYSKDLLELYQHELIQTLIDQEEYREFSRQVVDHNRLFLHGEELLQKDPLSKLIARSVGTASEFVTWLKDIVGEIGSQLHDSEDSMAAKPWHMEVLVSVHKILTRFESLLQEPEMEISYAVALNLIRRMLATVSVPFSGEPLEGLQVLGILETRTLDFRNLIVLSMNEGSFPKTGHAPSFIPFALRESFGLPTIRHQDAIYSYYFYRLLHRAEKVVLVYNTLTEGLQKGEASRFIQQLRHESFRAVRNIDMSYDSGLTPVLSIQGKRSESTEDALDKKLKADQKSFISPSAINTYLSCPLKFYFRYVEKIKEPEEISEEVEAGIFGSILHETMQILYAAFETKMVQEGDIRNLLADKKLLDRAIDQAFNKVYFKDPPNTKVEYRGRNLIVRKVIRSYAENVLQYDKQHAPFRILALEKAFSHSFQLEENGTSVRIGGFIDRLDEKEGVIRVIDYKTGIAKPVFSSQKSIFEAPKPSELDAVRQSMVYSCIIRHAKSQPVHPALYYVRDIIEEDYDPRIIDRKQGPVNDFSPYAEEFEADLIRVVSEMLNKKTVYTQTENTDNCKYCPYAGICMRKDLEK